MFSISNCQGNAVKAMMRYLYIPVRTAKIEKKIMTNLDAAENVENLGLSYTFDE